MRCGSAATVATTRSLCPSRTSCVAATARLKKSPVLPKGSAACCGRTTPAGARAHRRGASATMRGSVGNCLTRQALPAALGDPHPNRHASLAVSQGSHRRAAPEVSRRGEHRATGPRTWVYTSDGRRDRRRSPSPSRSGASTRDANGCRVPRPARSAPRSCGCPTPARVSDLMVHEGDVVSAGTALAQLTVDRSGTNDAAGNEAVIGELNKQAESQRQQRDETIRLGQQQRRPARRDASPACRNEIREADVEIKLQNERLAQARQLLDKWLDLKAKDYASELLRAAVPEPGEGPGDQGAGAAAPARVAR